MMVVPGMISRVMFQSVRDDPNTAFIVLVQRRLPMGARGIMIAAMLAALMSSLASVFHSSSTLFTMDIYRVAKAKYLSWKRTRSGERDVMLEDHVEHTSSNEDHSSSSTESSAGEGTEYVLVGRIAGIVVTLVGVLWIPLVQLLSQQLYIYTHKVMSYTAPPIAVVFLFGILWKRANAYGALTVMLFGFVFGMSRLILEAIVTSNPNMIQDSPEFIATVLTIFVQSNFLHFSACFTLISSIIMIIVSLVSPAPSEEQAKWTITVAHMKAMFSKGGEEVEESPIEHREETSRWSFIKKHSGHIINLGMTGVLLAGVVGLYTGFA
jgi:SSS family solute:Na+ symporter